jgi:taurine dioxygenase
LSKLTIRPLTGALGAEILGADLSRGVGSDVVRAVREALLANGVVAIRDQKLDRRAQVEFGRQLGTLDVHPIANGMKEYPEMIRVLKPAGEAAYFGTGWHSDNSFFAEPSAITVLYGETVPDVGGDTLFASMERAYEALSSPLRAFLDPLVAVHSAGDAYDPRTTGDAKYKGETAITYTFSEAIYDEVEHPVIRTHPETGRRSLFVNPMFTQRIVALGANESAKLLELLYEHCARPDFSCRVRWEPGTLTLWDNRFVQHYALDDYEGFERVMYRVTVKGDRPISG